MSARNERYPKESDRAAVGYEISETKTKSLRRKPREGESLAALSLSPPMNWDPHPNGPPGDGPPPAQIPCAPVAAVRH